MISAVLGIEVPVEETEAYQELMTRAGRRTGNIPADLIVRHVLAQSQEGEGAFAAACSGRDHAGPESFGRGGGTVVVILGDHRLYGPQR